MSAYGSNQQNDPAYKAPQYEYGRPMDGGKMPGDYPEADLHYSDGEPVEGEPLYPPCGEGPSNPHLRRFVKKGWKDVWAGALFMVFFVMTFVWGTVNMARYTPLPSSPTTPAPEEAITTTTFSIFFTIACAFVLSIFTACGGLTIMSLFPGQIIYIANVFSIGLTIVSAILCFAYVSPVAGIVSLFVVGINLLWFYFARQRIPFSAAMMRAATGVLSRHKAIFVLKGAMVGVLFVYTIFWAYVLLPSADRTQHDVTTAFDTFVLCLFVFTFYWVMQVLPNVMLVTTSGVTATWYFVGFDNMPPNPTLKSFVRAITTSFGSICFGSLIVAVIQFLRWLVESSRNDGDRNFLTCILDCILSLLQGIVEYINQYAYVHIAMYGYDYITAAKHTFELFDQCLYSALFNDSLVNPTLNMLTLALSLFVSVLFGLGFWSFPVGVVAFFISVVVHSLFFTAVSSAVLTIFVCFAEVPEALSSTDPDLYDLFVQADQGATNNAMGRV